jgi:hypothetical protein
MRIPRCWLGRRHNTHSLRRGFSIAQAIQLAWLVEKFLSDFGARPARVSPLLRRRGAPFPRPPRSRAARTAHTPRQPTFTQATTVPASTAAPSATAQRSSVPARPALTGAKVFITSMRPMVRPGVSVLPTSA